MNTARIPLFLSLSLTLALMLSVAIGRPAFAALGATPEQAIKGTVQNIDYLHHAITINGQTYVVAPNARFSGVTGFSILHIGMPIAYVLGSSPVSGSSSEHHGPQALPPGPPSGDSGMAQPDNGPPVITSITWLPGGV